MNNEIEALIYIAQNRSDLIEKYAAMPYAMRGTKALRDIHGMPAQETARIRQRAGDASRDLPEAAIANALRVYGARPAAPKQAEVEYQTLCVECVNGNHGDERIRKHSMEAFGTCGDCREAKQVATYRVWPE